MKKNKILTILVGTAMAISLPFAVSAAGNVMTETIGNLIYEIPADWTTNTSSTGDTVTNTYTDGDAALVVTYMSTDLDMMDSDTSIQKIMLDSTLTSFESYDNYSELSNDYYQFEENAGNVRLFTYSDGGTNYTTVSNVMYTGEGIGMFLFGCPTMAVSNVDFDVFSDISESIKTVSSTDESASSEVKDYTKYSSNFYKVGVDIPAGEYVVFAEGGSGYFCVSPDSNQDDITFNDNFDYNSIITVNDGEYLELSRCYAVPFDENPEVDLAGSGMFKVGTHIPAGEYKLEVTGSHGYYCIYPDSRQDDIIANDNFENQNYVTVSDGQYLILSGCKFAETPTKPMKSYTDADTVKKVQEALNAAGYDCGTPDGIAGSGTKGQIEKYQTDKGLTVTGTITDELLEALGI